MKLIGLGGYYSKSAFAVSSQEFIVTAKKFDHDDRTPKYNGLVLHTKDGGKTWRIIYRYKNEITQAQTLGFVSSSFLLLTENGTLHRMTTS